MTYRLILKQSGGCDYTIGCGVQVVDLSATTLVDARAEARRWIIDEYGDKRGPERSIVSAEIVQIERSSWLFRDQP